MRYIYIYLEPICPLFLGFNPPKEGPFQSKQGSFGLQVYIYIYGCFQKLVVKHPKMDGLQGKTHIKMG